MNPHAAANRRWIAGQPMCSWLDLGGGHYDLALRGLGRQAGAGFAHSLLALPSCDLAAAARLRCARVAGKRDLALAQRLDRWIAVIFAVARFIFLFPPPGGGGGGGAPLFSEGRCLER